MNLSSALANDLGTLRVDGRAAGVSLDLNSGASVTATSFLINEGGTTAGDTGTVNVNSGASLTFSGGQIARESGTATLNVEGSVTQTGGFTFRNNVSDAAGIVNVTGSGSYNTNSRVTMSSADAQLNLSDSATFSQSTDFIDMRGGSNAGSKANITLTGSNVSFTANQIVGFSTTDGSTAEISFVADASGVSAMSLGVLDLNNPLGFATSILNVDLSAMSIVGSTSLVLADFTGSGLFGTFDTINLTGATFDSIDYATGNQITLSVAAIPEPASALFLGLAGVALALVKRRKRA